MSFKNKVAIVTGGSRGIGRAIVLKLAHLGCDVVFSYHQNKDAAHSLENEVKNLGGRCQASSVDVKDFSAVKSWIEDVKKNFGGIDILINNAGVIRDKPLMMMSEDDWQEVMDTNLNGMFHVTRACIITLMKQKSGRIVNISSVSGVIGLPGQTNYSASKGGINAFTKALAKEVAAFGIRVNAIAPGFIDTEMVSKFSPEQKEKIIEMIPLKRMGSVEDVANAVAFLLSDDTRYITGQILNIDGGLVIR